MLVQIVAPTGEIIYTNGPWRKILGYNEEDLRDLSLLDLVASSEKEAMKALLQGKPRETQKEASLTLRAKDGRQIRLHGTLSWQLEGSRVACIHGFFQPISETTELSATPEPELRIMLETTSEVVLTTDTEGLVRSLSPAFESLLGLSRTEWIGKPLSQLVVSDDKVLLTDTFFRLLKGGSVTPLEVQILTKHSESFPVLLSVRPLHESGRLKGAVIRLADLREKRKLEAAISDGENRFRALMDSPFQAAVIHDEVSILEANALFQSLIESNRSLEARPLSDFLTTEGPPSESASRGILVTKSGRSIPVEICTRRIPYRSGTACLTLIHRL